MKRHAGGAWRRRASVLVAIVAIAVGGAVVISPQSASAVGCSGHTCNGRDPEANGCDTGPTQTRTRFSKTVDDMWTYQLRHSFACLSMWGRFIRDDCSYPSPVHHWLRVDTQIWSLNEWRPYATQVDDMWGETSNCNGGTAWTPMVPGQENTRSRLGWGTNVSSSPPSSWSYSGWYNGGRP